MTTKITEQNVSNLANAGIDWQAVKTSNFTASAGEGYFVNTTGGAVTVNLPAGVAGAIVGLKDYAGTWQTNAVTLNPEQKARPSPETTTTRRSGWWSNQLAASMISAITSFVRLFNESGRAKVNVARLPSQVTSI